MDGSASGGSGSPVFPTPALATTTPAVTVRPRARPALGLTPRRSVSAGKAAEARSLQRFVRQEYWNGLAAGDVVRVAGHTARGRHWRFRAHVTNTSNGASWVEVALVDGPAPSRRPLPGEDESPNALHLAARIEKVRSFEPDLVAPRWRSRARPRLRGRVRLDDSSEPAESAEPQGSSLEAAGAPGDRQPSLF